MKGGATGVETYVKPIWLVWNACNSKLKRYPGRTKNITETTCLIKSEVLVLADNDLSLTWWWTPVAPPFIYLLSYGLSVNAMVKAVSQNISFVSCFFLRILTNSANILACFKRTETI